MYRLIAHTATLLMLTLFSLEAFTQKNKDVTEPKAKRCDQHVKPKNKVKSIESASSKHAISKPRRASASDVIKASKPHVPQIPKRYDSRNSETTEPK